MSSGLGTSSRPNLIVRHDVADAHPIHTMGALVETPPLARSTDSLTPAIRNLQLGTYEPLFPGGGIVEPYLGHALPQPGGILSLVDEDDDFSSESCCESISSEQFVWPPDEEYGVDHLSGCDHIPALGGDNFCFICLRPMTLSAGFPAATAADDGPLMVETVFEAIGHAQNSKEKAPMGKIVDPYDEAIGPGQELAILDDESLMGRMLARFDNVSENDLWISAGMNYPWDIEPRPPIPSVSRPNHHQQEMISEDDGMNYPWDIETRQPIPSVTRLNHHQTEMTSEDDGMNHHFKMRPLQPTPSVSKSNHHQPEITPGKFSIPKQPPLIANPHQTRASSADSSNSSDDQRKDEMKPQYPKHAAINDYKSNDHQCKDEMKPYPPSPKASQSNYHSFETKGQGPTLIIPTSSHPFLRPTFSHELLRTDSGPSQGTDLLRPDGSSYTSSNSTLSFYYRDTATFPFPK